MKDERTGYPADPLDFLLSARGVIKHFEEVENEPELGLWQLTVEDAAALIAMDFWFAGDIKADLPEAESYDPKDPAIRHALADHCRKFEASLATAIDRGALRASRLCRDFNERIVVEETLVDFRDLCRWYWERGGYEFGDAFEDYAGGEFQVYEESLSAVAYVRALHQQGRRPFSTTGRVRDNLDEASAEELRGTVRELTIQNANLLHTHQTGLKVQIKTTT